MDSKTIEVLAPVRLRENGEVFDIHVRHRPLPDSTYLRRRVARRVRVLRSS
jgi:hypothetical protein